MTDDHDITEIEVETDHGEAEFELECECGAYTVSEDGDGVHVECGCNDDETSASTKAMSSMVGVCGSMAVLLVIAAVVTAWSGSFQFSMARTFGEWALISAFLGGWMAWVME